MANNIDKMINELEEYSKVLTSGKDGSISSILMPKIITIIKKISTLVNLNLEYDTNHINDILKTEYMKPASFYIDSKIKDVKDYQNKIITDQDLLSEYKNVEKNMYFNGVCSPKREYNRVTNKIELHIYLKNSTKILEAQKLGIRTMIKNELQISIPDMIISNIDNIQNNTMKIMSSNMETNKSQSNGKQFTYSIKGRENLYPNNEIN